MIFGKIAATSFWSCTIFLLNFREHLAEKTIRDRDPRHGMCFFCLVASHAKRNSATGHNTFGFCGGTSRQLWMLRVSDSLRLQSAAARFFFVFLFGSRSLFSLFSSSFSISSTFTLSAHLTAQAAQCLMISSYHGDYMWWSHCRFQKEFSEAQNIQFEKRLVRVWLNMASIDKPDLASSP